MYVRWIFKKYEAILHFRNIKNSKRDQIRESHHHKRPEYTQHREVKKKHLFNDIL